MIARALMKLLEGEFRKALAADQPSAEKTAHAEKILALMERVGNPKDATKDAPQQKG